MPKGIALSQLMKGVASAVAQAYRSGIWTRVEVSRTDTRGGHVYLELAERDVQGAAVAQARAMIWASTAAAILPAFERATGVVLAAGIKLLVRAKPTVHAVYGLSLEIDAIDPEYTLGDLEARKREIRERLQREGVFDANRRLAAPWDFNAVLVVAPERAAGLGDFHAEAQRLQRFGVCRFVYAHSRFQGEGAPALIRAALLRALDDWQPGALPDAVVFIRGGGAVNDLAWLNDYALARCICDLEVPVLTGIGHARDSTVLDEVAHRRFDTPSKVIAGIEQLIAQRARRAREHFEFVLHTARHQLQQARQETAQAVAHVRLQAVQSVRLGSEQSRSLLGEVRHQAAAHMGAARQALADGAQRSQALVREITGQGPHKTLGRGFAIVRRTGGAVVAGAAGLAAGEAIYIEFRDGTVAARMLKKGMRAVITRPARWRVSGRRSMEAGPLSSLGTSSGRAADVDGRRGSVLASRPRRAWHPCEQSRFRFARTAML